MTRRREAADAPTQGMRINPKLEPLAVPLASLRLDPENARKHPLRNLEAIEASLREHGQQTPIVANSRGVIRKGNGTFLAAQNLGASRIAVVVYDGPSEDKYAIADNRTGELAEWDDAVLSQVVGRLAREGEGHFDPADIGFSPDEVRKLLAEEEFPTAPAFDESAADDVPMVTCPNCSTRFPA